MQRTNQARRRFLRGVGGLAVGLPALDIFEGRANAQAAGGKKIYAAMMLQQNGAVQANGSDPNLFWPSVVGPIDAAAMAGVDAAQTTSVLKDYASKLNFIRGLNFHYSNNHDGGGIAAGTGSPIVGADTHKLPTNESWDYNVARNLTPGKDPLTLYAGKKGTFRDDALSFGTGGMLRIGDNNPWNVYQRVMGLAAADPAVLAKLKAKRQSVNDFVRQDVQALLARTDLSKADRDRLALHLQSIRDLEVGMSTVLGPLPDSAGMQAITAAVTTDNNMVPVVQFQLDLIAFCFATDRVRTATLQVGGCNDHTRYTINGVQQPPYHYISHRVQSDGSDGTPIANAIDLHHQVDVIHANYFKHFLDKLSAYTLPQGGTLLDSSVNIWANSVSDGPPHSGKNLPFVTAGNAGGYLKTGVHAKLTGYNSKLLNTIISACGVTAAGGGPIDNFNDPMGTGLITEIVA